MSPSERGSFVTERVRSHARVPPQGYSSESLVACRGLELKESENPRRARAETQAEIPERGNNQSGVLVTCLATTPASSP